MHVLLPENHPFDMNEVPDQFDDDRQYAYAVLDYSNQQPIDFYFIPLIFLDKFPRPAADLRIGKWRVQMPLDWSIVIADKHSGSMEIIELKHLNDRPFEAFIYNPVNGYMPSFGEITIENIYPDVTWTMPKLKYGHILAVPLEDGDSPACAFFVKDVNRLPESLDISKIFS